MKRITSLLLAFLLSVVVLCSTGLTAAGNEESGSAATQSTAGTASTNSAAAANSSGQKVPAEVASQLAAKGLQQVAATDAMALYADEKSGNIALYTRSENTVWYSNPPEYMGQKLIGQEKVLSASQVSITCYDAQFLASEALGYTGSVKKGGLSAQKLSDGIRFTYRFETQGITVALEYHLKKDYLEVTVPVKRIVQDGDYRLGAVRVLPFFGSGAPTDTGYLFVPDGSGALIDFAGTGTAAAYSQEVYGFDRTMSKNRRLTDAETVRLPVLGIHTKDQGLLCVVENGAGLATVQAQQANQKEQRNMAYFSFQCCPSNRLTLNSSDRNARDVLAFARKMAQTDSFRLRYYPLQGKGEYSDMAVTYRNYLMEKGFTKSANQAQLPFYVTSYGAIRKQGSFCFIPMTITLPLTTYEGLSGMIQVLEKQGISQVTVDYQGFYQGGYNGKLPVKGQLERKLGSAKDLEELLALTKSGSSRIFAGLNLVDFYTPGNGFSKTSGIARTVTGAPALQYRYSLVSGFQDSNFTPWYLLSPLNYKKVLTKYQSSYQRFDFSGISMGAAAGTLYSDFRGEGTDRLAMEQIYTSAFEQAKKSGSVLGNSANAFLLPVTDEVLSLPMECSGFECESRSVPFYQMVLSGYKNYSIPAVNLSRDPQEALLFAAETGSSLYYVFNDQNTDELAGTCLQQLSNSDYRRWLTDAGEYNQRLQALHAYTKGGTIVKHERDGLLVRVTYDNGAVVLVNYGTTDLTTEQGVVSARSWLTA